MGRGNTIEETILTGLLWNTVVDKNIKVQDLKSLAIDLAEGIRPFFSDKDEEIAIILKGCEPPLPEKEIEIALKRILESLQKKIRR